MIIPSKKSLVAVKLRKLNLKIFLLVSLFWGWLVYGEGKVGVLEKLFYVTGVNADARRFGLFSTINGIICTIINRENGNKVFFFNSLRKLRFLFLWCLCTRAVEEATHHSLMVIKKRNCMARTTETDITSLIITRGPIDPCLGIGVPLKIWNPDPVKDKKRPKIPINPV